MAATTKLIIYNAALREIGSTPLANISETGPRLTELTGAWDHAVEHMLAKVDWNFARRRSTLTAAVDSGFPPYTRRATKPSDYLRKTWLKTTAYDEYQVDHAEVAASIYMHEATALLEYISDHADNYDPANWPAHFTRAMTLYLASLVAPKLARAGADDMGRLSGQMQQAFSDAEAIEAVFLLNEAIPLNRQPVMRRALEIMGQALSGSVPVHAQADKLRWAMNRAWTHCLKFVLEQGAWNFATKRTILTDGTTADNLIPSSDVAGIVEGFSYGTASASTTSLPSLSGHQYGYPLPGDFLHKIWIKPLAHASVPEAAYQILGSYILTSEEPLILEYVAYDDDTTDPANWSATFLDAVAAYLALSVTPELLIEPDSKGRARVTANDLRGKLEAVYRDKLSNARCRDALQQEVLRPPLGSFARARFGGSRYHS